MFVNYKWAGLNYFIMTLLVLLIIMVQNSLWPSFFGTHFPLYLWIPCLIYWSLYRRIGETVLMAYFIAFCLASSSPLMLGYLLSFNSLVLLILLLFKKIYYTSWVFFSVSTAGALFFFPLIIWIFAEVMGGHSYFYGFLPELGGAILTWIFSFALLGFFQWIDHLTITKPKETKQPAGGL